jgi:hypothetical protein
LQHKKNLSNAKRKKEKEKERKKEKKKTEEKKKKPPVHLYLALWWVGKLGGILT